MGRVAVVVLALVALVALPGCGDAADTPGPAQEKPRELVYMSRNTLWAVPEDVAIYDDGAVAYRQLLHTKISMKVRRTRLSPTALARLRELIAHTRLAGADLPGAAQPRNGFRYLLRLDGRSISTVDGRLAPGVRPLIRRLGRLEDRMLLRGE
ncbi:MAG TPA: hypothetical protein VFM58_24870 [Solirubrobacteraceae bacterium]|nr:hypothetical protein [Solirubrobacteraceae bacterium]